MQNRFFVLEIFEFISEIDRIDLKNYTIFREINFDILERMLTHNSTNGVKFILREIRRIFLIKLRSFKLKEMPEI